MKTTVEIADGLFAEAKALAARRKVTLRELIQDGLRSVLEREQMPAPPFKLRDGSYGEGGMVKDFTWSEIRDLIYDDDGGLKTPDDRD